MSVYRSDGRREFYYVPNTSKMPANAAKRVKSRTPSSKRIEDRAVDEAIALQLRAGLDVISDGEMRRLRLLRPT